MRTFECRCGNRIFFDNSLCLACESELGFCTACHNLAALEPSGEMRWRCHVCATELVKCHNYAKYNVCNRCVPASLFSAPGVAGGFPLCDCCRFNATIPDLSVPGNLDRWYRLETAKRRLLYELRELGLPFGTREDGVEPPLAFDFKADVIPADNFWRSIGETEKVYTGHSDGRITINIREADDVEREKLRVDFGEAHRTLIGHFRHEIGHYYWDMLVRGKCEAEFIAVFGDFECPSYAEALQHYYEHGAAANWPEQYISAYASMHPWEDFAETFATYLDMISILDTAHHMELGGIIHPLRRPLDELVIRYQQLGIALNELNRSVGLLDVVPEIFRAPILKKLRFVHELVRRTCASEPSATAAQTS